MKRGYDFSKGERGRFFQHKIKAYLPIHLEPEIIDYVEKLAEEKGTDISTVMNELLRGEMLMAQSKK